MTRMIFAVLAAYALLGCAQQELKPDADPKAPDMVGAESGAPMAQEPGVRAPAGQPEKEARATLARLEKAQSMTSRAYLAMPGDKKIRGAHVAATNALALQWMSMDSIPAREKYRNALKLYREVLKVDPSNAEAQKWIQTIEGIYRQLGRPIPKV